MRMLMRLVNRSLSRLSQSVTARPMTSLKIASPPKLGARGYALKRVSCPWWAKLRFEAYFAFKADHPDYRLGHEAVESLIFGYDLQDYDALFSEKLDLLLKIRADEKVTWEGVHRAPLEHISVFPRPIARNHP